VQNLGKIIVDNDISVYYKVNIIPYVTGITHGAASLSAPLPCRQLRQAKSRNPGSQGWEILDDETFMAQYRANCETPGSPSNTGKPQIKHRVRTYANMHRAGPIPSRVFTPSTGHVHVENMNYALPTLAEIKAELAKSGIGNIPEDDLSPDEDLQIKLQKLRSKSPLASTSKQGLTIKMPKKKEPSKNDETSETSVMYTPQIKSITEIAPPLDWKDEESTSQHTTPDITQGTQLEELIPALVTQSISEMEFFKLLKCDATFIASAITSSILAIGTSLHTLCTMETTMASKVLNSVAVVSSLTTFCLALHKLFEKYNLSNNVSSIYPQLPELANTILNSQNKANSLAWIYPAISTLVAIVVGALTTFKICDVKSVIEQGRLLNSAKSFSSTANDITKVLLEDIAGLDITGDQKAFAELHNWAKRSSELSVKSVMEFIQNPELNAEIHKAVEVTIPIITNKYQNKDLSHAARGAYQLILTNVQKLQEKVEAMKIITDACKRIETFGVFFGGKKGLGKSRLCLYVAEYIANIMGLPKTMYNLNKSKDTGFYGPYGGAAFAEIQEFMALKEQDPNLAHINQIISGDHFNLEAAHLGGKQQPLNARIVFLTANNLCPDLMRVLEKEAAKATWDRILRFEVIDEKVQGRTGVNAHRRPDFSHLKFNFVTSTDEVDPSNLTKRPVTIDEVLGIILYQTALREHQFLLSGVQQTVIPTEESAKRLKFLQDIIDRNTIANAGQDFNILRLEGPQYQGKTKTANLMASYLNGILPTWNTTKVRSFNDLPVEKGIYIVDDMIELSRESYASYLHWINSGHEDNFYIVCSNHTYPQKWNRNYLMIATTPYWYVDTHGCSSGVARRLGLEGEIKCSDGSGVSSRLNTQINIPKVGTLLHNGKDITLHELKELVFNKFQDYLRCKEIISVRYESYTNTSLDYDCVVKVKSYEHFAKTFASVSSVISARLGLIKGVSLTFKNHLIQDITRHFSSEKQLLPGRVVDAASLIDQAEAIAVILNRAVPGLSARLVIEDSGDDLVLYDRVLYVGYNVPSDVLQIKHSASKQTIEWTFLGEVTQTTYAKYAAFFKTGIIPDEMEGLQPEVLSRLNMYVKDNVGDSLFAYQSFLCDMKLAKQQFCEQNFATFAKNRPIITLIGGLLTLTTAGTIIALIAKAFSSEPIKCTSNSAPDENDYDPRISIFAKKFKQAILQGDNEVRAVREEVARGGLTQQFNQWEHDWRSNSSSTVSNYLPIALEKGDINEIVRLCELNGETAKQVMLSTYSNMLSRKDEKHQTSGPLEQLAERLRHNYVHVLCGYGNLYGLMIKGNLGITTGHCVDNVSKTLTITSNGNEYLAKIEKVTRARDLCTFRVISKTWPAASDISSLFPSYGEMLDLTSGWYIRPTTTPLIVNAPIEYIDRHASPLTDSNNPFFRVEGKSWKYRLTGISSCRNTFKIGDCGFPLVGTVNNQFYIIGIHNAFSNSGLGWFASVSRDDISEITANSCEVRSAKKVKHPLLGESMVLDDKMHDLVMDGFTTSKYEGVSPLKVHGYNKKLHFMSFPKHQKKYCDVASKHLTCETVGSALDTTHVKNFDKLYADRDGKYYPLFTQAVKYALAQEKEESFDKEIDSHVTHFLATYYKMHYTSEKVLKPHEIINGMQNLKPLDMSTSAGPKMKKLYNINSKRPLGNENALFKNESKTDKPWYIINTETPAGGALLSDYCHYLSMIQQGTPVCVVVKDNAKVELLPVSKVEEGKVRLFNEMDLSINMMLKAYFGAALDKVMEKHDSGMFCIGMNPYKDATTHMFYFNMMDGDYINADFSALDKTVTAHLISDFVNCFLPHLSEESRIAMAKTLTYRLHSMNGNVYFVDSGNASGSFVTTLLNCHVVAKVSLYTFVRRFKEEFGHLPSYAEIEGNVILRILGDDGIRKYQQIFKTPITQEELIADAAKYRLTQTPAKTSGEISFCSREYIQYKRVYFPRLKKSSITSCLFWFRSNNPEQVFQNCFTAIMEAGLWDKEFFDSITSAVVDLAKTFRFKMDLASYEMVQECWHDYITGRKNSPVWGRSNPECISENISSNSTSNFLRMADMWLNEYVQKNKLEQPDYKYSAEGPENALTWKCKITLLDNQELITGEGVGCDKAESKREACEDVRQQVAGSSRSNAVEIEWLCYTHLGKEYHVAKCEQQRKNDSGIFKSNVAFLRYMKEQYPAISFMEKDARMALMKTRCTTAIKTAVEGHVQAHVLPRLTEKVNKYVDTLCDKENITREELIKLDELISDLDVLKVTSNMGPGDMPIEPAVMNQAMNAQSAASLPSQTNPQPTSMAPAVTAPGDDIMAALQIAQETTLNPMGAPNMLSVGAIGFDIKMLIYEQFLDCDTQFSTTESAPTGSIILQIPYAVVSQYTNYYIKAYASLHKRYTGSIKFRVTGIGNQLLSGAIGVCWVEERQDEATILISEAQKIAYEMKGVNNPFNEIHTLHDARQTEFYRTVLSDTTEPLDKRPHLVLFVGMNVYNPYRDNTLVRFRIASKLSNGREPNPFFFALPTNQGSVVPNTQANTVSPARAFNEVFTQTLNTPIYVYTDGSLRNGVAYKRGTRYPPYTPKAVNNAAYRFIFNGSFQRAAMTTSVAHQFTESELTTKWSRIYQFFRAQAITPLHTIVGIVSQSTMDSENFCVLTGSSSYPGFGRIITTNLPEEANWDFMKTLSGWQVSFPEPTFVPVNDIQIQAILYNDTEIALGTFTASVNRTYYYARFGQIKLVTNYGTAVYYLIATTTQTGPAGDVLRRNHGLLSQWQTSPTTPSQAVFKDLADYPNLNIDNSLGALPNFVSLPLGYQAIRFSDIPASALTIDDYPGPTATDESCIERWFYNRTLDMPTTRCMEMELVDSTSQRIVAIVRYFQEWRLFVINAETPNYRALPFGTDNLIIQSLVEIERVNSFPVTNTSLWFSRTSEVVMAGARALIPDEEFQEVTSNAALMMGAGVLSGIGQGLNQMGTRKHEKEMQGNLFGHELTMQGNMFEQQSLMQGNQHGHEQRMALMNQDFQNMMQSNRFGQEKEMTVLQANENRATNRMQSQNRMTEKGLGTKTNFLNTSFGTSV